MFVVNHMRVRKEGKVVGYLPVYETKEDALADYPDAEIREIGASSGRNRANSQGVEEGAREEAPSH